MPTFVGRGDVGRFFVYRTDKSDLDIRLQGKGCWLFARKVPTVISASIRSQSDSAIAIRCRNRSSNHADYDS
jgi:hypothetical protein